MFVGVLWVQNHCGSLRVVSDAATVLGIFTDRDLAVRAFAEGKSAETKVREVMTANPACCGADDDVEAVQRTMADRQVRRVPIVDADGCCVGIIAQADLARATDHDDVTEHEVAVVVERISEPAPLSGRRETEQLEERF